MFAAFGHGCNERQPAARMAVQRESTGEPYKGIPTMRSTRLLPCLLASLVCGTSPVLADGGFLILHDTALPEWGVKAVCQELKNDPGLELVGEYFSKKHNRPLGVALFKKVY